VDLTLRWEIPVLPSAFLIAVGWSSQFYVPQKLGGSVMAIGNFDRGAIWHVGQVFLTLHWRVPYEVRL
ncbi:MAG: hypothetical protein HY902_05675, partial [Deltaproteobacteria bacterium]|nr:hypothetical protein [Deltaproteobacteria bacterium]